MKVGQRNYLPAIRRERDRYSERIPLSGEKVYLGILRVDQLNSRARCQVPGLSHHSVFCGIDRKFGNRMELEGFHDAVLMELDSPG